MGITRSAVCADIQEGCARSMQPGLRVRLGLGRAGCLNESGWSTAAAKAVNDRMAAAVASIEALGVRAVGITADCTVEAEVAHAFDKAAAALASVDFCAVGLFCKEILSLPWAEYASDAFKVSCSTLILSVTPRFNNSWPDSSSVKSKVF